MKQINLIATVFVGLLLLLLNLGCAGHGGSQTGLNPYSGTYDGSTSIGSRAGDFSISVATDGTTTGTFTVGQDGSAGGRGEAIPPGEYDFFGTTTVGGGIDVQGIINGFPFDLTGHLPQSGATTELTLTYNGNNYQVSTEEHSSGGGGGNGGTASFTFTNIDSNYHLGETWPSEYTVTFANEEVEYRLSTTAELPGYHYNISINVSKTHQVGDVINLSGSNKIAVNENPDGEFLPNAWASDSGTATITAISGTTLSVTISNAHMVPVFGDAAGSFTINGSMSH